MTSVVDRTPITEWLEALLISGTGYPVGWGKAPNDVTGAPGDYPYLVVYVINATPGPGAPFVAPDADSDLVYQVDSVGLLSRQVEEAADRVRRTILARDAKGAFQVQQADPAPFVVADRQPTSWSNSDRSGVKPHEVVSWSERFTLRVVGG